MFDCTRLGGPAAEDGVMTAPNPAVDAQPGDRFTDPDGGTWVRLMDAGAFDPVPVWRYVSPSGGSDIRRSQEEAEAAGLVRLIPAVGYHYDERGEDVVPDAAAPAPIPLGASAVTDAERAGEAETFLAHWAGGNRVSAKDREDFIAAWTGWHRGADFNRECAERDAKAAIDAYVSALATERAELTAALADARSATPVPLDPGNPEHLRQVADFLVNAECVGGGSVDAVVAALGRVADRLDCERAEAEQEAADRAAVREILAEQTPKEIGIPFDHTGIADQNRAIERALVFYRAGRAGRQEAEKAGFVCCCGATRVPAGELSVIDADTVHRHGGPCYVVDAERQEAEK